MELTMTDRTYANGTTRTGTTGTTRLGGLEVLVGSRASWTDGTAMSFAGCTGVDAFASVFAGAPAVDGSDAVARDRQDLPTADAAVKGYVAPATVSGPHAWSPPIC